MANEILHKRSNTASSIPTTGDLSLGEIAINTNDGKLFFKKNDGTESIVVIEAGGGGSTTLGGLTDVDTSGATTDNVLTYNGSTWDAQAPTGGVTAGEFVDIYAATGGQSFTTTAITIALDNVRKTSNAATFTLSNNEVTVNKTGTYEIYYSISTTQTGSSRSTAKGWLEVNTVEVPNSAIYNYARGYSDKQLSSTQLILDITAGDILRLRTIRNNGSGTLLTVASSCQLLIKEAGNLVSGGGGASAINDLSDVDTTTTAPNVDDVLSYDGNNWVPTIASSSGGGNGTISLVAGEDISAYNFVETHSDGKVYNIKNLIGSLSYTTYTPSVHISIDNLTSCYGKDGVYMLAYKNPSDLDYMYICMVKNNGDGTITIGTEIQYLPLVYSSSKIFYSSIDDKFVIFMEDSSTSDWYNTVASYDASLNITIGTPTYYMDLKYIEGDFSIVDNKFMFNLCDSTNTGQYLCDGYISGNDFIMGTHYQISTVNPGRHSFIKYNPYVDTFVTLYYDGTNSYFSTAYFGPTDTCALGSTQAIANGVTNNIAFIFEYMSKIKDIICIGIHDNGLYFYIFNTTKQAIEIRKEKYLFKSTAVLSEYDNIIYNVNKDYIVISFTNTFGSDRLFSVVTIDDNYFINYGIPVTYSGSNTQFLHYDVFNKDIISLGPDSSYYLDAKFYTDPPITDRNLDNYIGINMSDVLSSETATISIEGAILTDGKTYKRGSVYYLNKNLNIVDRYEKESIPFCKALTPSTIKLIDSCFELSNEKSDFIDDPNAMLLTARVNISCGDIVTLEPDGYVRKPKMTSDSYISGFCSLSTSQRQPSPICNYISSIDRVVVFTTDMSSGDIYFNYVDISNDIPVASVSHYLANGSNTSNGVWAKEINDGSSSLIIRSGADYNFYCFAVSFSGDNIGDDSYFELSEDSVSLPRVDYQYLRGPGIFYHDELDIFFVFYCSDTSSGGINIAAIKIESSGPILLDTYLDFATQYLRQSDGAGYHKDAKKLIFFSSDKTNYDMYGSVISFKDGSIVVGEFQLVLDTIQTNDKVCAYHEDKNLLFMAYNRVNTYLHVLMIDIDPITEIITVSPESDTLTTDAENNRSIQLVYDKKYRDIVCMFSYHYADGFAVARVVPGDTINDPITFGSITATGTNSFIGPISSLYVEKHGKFVAGNEHYDGDQLPQLYSGYFTGGTSSNINNAFGVALGSAKSGDTVACKGRGGIIKGQGLTFNSDYYVDGFGNLTTTATNNKLIGKAFSDSGVYINIDW